MSTRAPIRVMLVDDNEIVRKGLQETLEHANDFAVVGQTGEGEEALGLAERLRPDVILMDVLMPGTNGIDACREITTAMPDAKVLMLTAFSDRDAMDDGIGRGSDGVLAQAVGQGPTLEHPARRGGRALPLVPSKRHETRPVRVVREVLTGRTLGQGPGETVAQGLGSRWSSHGNCGWACSHIR